MTIEEQLRKINVEKVRLSSGLTLQQALKKEVDRLYNCIQHYIDEYYTSYNPSVYERTYRFQSAMYTQNFLDARVVGNTIQLSITFHDSLAFHDSLNGDSVYVPILINYGWSHKGYENKPDDHFHKYSGFHFIEKGIADFNRTNPLNIKIDVSSIWKGKEVP